MKYKYFIIFLLCIFSFQINAKPSNDETLVKNDILNCPNKNNYRSLELISIMKAVKCPTCMGQSIYDADNEAAQKLRNEVTELYSQSFNKQQILSILQKKYSQEILFGNHGASKFIIVILAFLTIIIIYALAKRRNL